MQRTPLPLPRNPITYRLHRRDMVRQVYLPLGLVLAVVLALITLVILAAFGVVGTPAADSAWADVSLIYLSIFAIIFALVPLALFGGLVYGMTYVLRYVPGYARLVQDYVAKAARVIRRTADRVTAPVIAARRGVAAVQGGAQSLSERMHRQ